MRWGEGQEMYIFFSFLALSLDEHSMHIVLRTWKDIHIVHSNFCV